MCEFCVQHGEGKKWYLQAKNYSEDLLNDARRRKFFTEFFSAPAEEILEKAVDRFDTQMDRLHRAPGFVRQVLQWRIVSQAKKVHYGQVLPIEDVERIFDFVTSIVRLACICRRATLHSEQRYCYGISMAPRGGQLAEFIEKSDFVNGPDSAGLETLTRDEALTAFREHERESLCHTVWTFVTPFVGGICNCDRSDCLAMKSTVTHSLPMMFRAEYVAQVDPEACNGCRACMRACQFGAIGYSAALKKSLVDPRQCYGCGVCRSFCTKNAISLTDRSVVPVAARIW